MVETQFLLEICGYEKNSNLPWLSLTSNIIVQYYFGLNCIGYLVMLQSSFSPYKNVLS